MIIDGIRFDHIRKCRCGRRPEVVTRYKGLPPGEGPTIIKCYCGRDPDAEDANGLAPLPRFCRSWSKTRAVRLWRDMNRPDRAG